MKLLQKIRQKWLWFIANRCYHLSSELSQIDAKNLYLLKLKIDEELRGKLKLAEKVEVKKHFRQVTK